MREMTKITAPILAAPTQPSPVSDTAPASDLREGQAALTIKREDLKGSVVRDGSVPLTPPVNAPAHSSA